ncbi:GDSL-type esterase/lipase family protein [Archangium primigenium]|uniref:GDSL-type esterase/lipase family protein n=1 Tax=[Archangium] primigenium TaxID=2792470 RepID=UPI0019560F8C|nr:GDSL-type esterase/lipase family protein [Archangium primigenium]MBM7112188.1 hypothetical protein [Archangium primigenium]
MFDAPRARRWTGLLLVPLLGVLAWGLSRPPSDPAPQRRPRAKRTARPQPPKPVLVASAPPAAPAPVRRLRPAPSPRALRLHQLGEKLGTAPPRLDNPCVAPEPGADTGPEAAPCARTALEPFFESLDALMAARATGPTTIAAFGNSLIAGDRIVDVVREELGATFGDAGRGVLLVDRLAPYGPRARSGHAQGEWEPRTLGEMQQAPLPFGLSGTYHQSVSARARSRFTVEGERRGTLWWLDVPEGGALSVRTEGQVLAATEPRGEGEARSLAFDIPKGTRSLEVVAEGKGAVVFGVVLQRAHPGLVLDTLGVPSSDANLFLRANEDIFRAQFAERAPRLLVFILGGNEAKRLEWGRSNLEEVEQGLRDFVRRARAAGPDAACLVVGPIDAVRGGTGAQRFVQRPYLDEVIAVERRIALAEGCAFFDIFSAMGGEGSLARFVEAGLVHEDLVHPRGQGLDLLGQLITDALVTAWVEGADTPPRAAPPRTSEAVP